MTVDPEQRAPEKRAGLLSSLLVGMFALKALIQRTVSTPAHAWSYTTPYCRECSHCHRLEIHLGGQQEASTGWWELQKRGSHAPCNPHQMRETQVGTWLQKH